MTYNGYPTYGAYLRSKNLQIAPVLGNKARSDKDREARCEKDMPAYRRLRNQGYQPPHIDGSYALERDSTTKFEIESGKAYPGRSTEVKQAVDFFEQGTGRSVFSPASAKA